MDMRGRFDSGVAGALLVLLLPAIASGQRRLITTIAGISPPVPQVGQPALAVPLINPHDLVLDPQGRLLLSDQAQSMVIRIEPDQTVVIVAGNGISGISGDGGPAAGASLAGPLGLVFDSAGALYISDSGNNRIRKVAVDGTITTVAGTGVAGSLGDGGPATLAQLNIPRGLAVDSNRNLYISDSANNRVRRVSPDGMITTIAGTGATGFSGDGGPATQATFFVPDGLAIDTAGNLYIADYGNGRVRKIGPDGVISTVAGGGTNLTGGDGGPATNVTLRTARGVALDTAGNLYITEDIRVRTVSPAGIITTIAGSDSGFVFSGDGGPATGAGLNNAEGIVVESDGTFVIADSSNQRIRAVSPQGIIQTIAGNGTPRFVGDTGPAIDSVLNGASDVAVDQLGNVYVDDSGNHRIRKITTAGIIQTIAGNGQVFGNVSEGAPATTIPLFGPSGIAVDSSERLYIALPSSILRMVPDGTVRTFVPNIPGGQIGQIAFDKANNLYIAAIGDNRIYKVSPGGVTTVVAGNGTRGFTGDGGPATSASLNAPAGVAVDTAGTVYIADWFNNRVRVVTPAGTISTLSGTGQSGVSGDGGPAQLAMLDTPYRLSLDASNNLYISTGGRIRAISPAGIITTVAGAGSLGDGEPAIDASISPNGLALDAAGNIYITDSSNHENRIREILVNPPVLTVSATQLTFSGLSGGAPAPKQSFSVSASIPRVSFTASVSGGASWLSITPGNGGTSRLIDVVADPANLPSQGYQAVITISAPDARPPSLTITVAFNVVPGAAPVLLVDSQSLSFSFPRSGIAQDQKLTVSNAGTGNLTFTAVASTTPPGSTWLTVSTSSGTATPATPAVLTVTADPTGLAPGPTAVW